ncbi:MAG: hypothetical protein ACK4UJ_03035 [Leptonema sp. (in: bacteria)]
MKFIKIINLVIIFSYCLSYREPFLNLHSYSLEDFENLKEREVIKKQEDTKKRKNVLTYYFAEELIRKKINKEGKEDYKIILQGGATILHEDTQISAPYIEIDSENNGIISGGLVISLKNQNTFLYAQKGEYNRKEEFVKLLGNPYMKLNSNDSYILITTDEIQRNIAEKTIIFKKYVKIFSKDWSLLGDESIYYDNSKEFVLKENPVLVGKKIYLTAKTMIYKSDEKKIIVNQKPIMITTIVSEGKKENPNKEKKNSSQNSKKEDEVIKEKLIITANTIEYFFETKDTNQDLKKIQKGILRGNVLMTSKTKTFKGEEFLILGKDISFVESNNAVTLEDKKENFFLRSNYMLYDLKNRNLLLKKNPELILYEKQSTNSSLEYIENDKQIKEKLTAEIIERDFLNEITIAKGNVHLIRKEEEMFSEYAKFNEKEEKIELLGNPILRRKKTELHCKKIDVFKDKVEIYGELRTIVYD